MTNLVEKVSSILKKNNLKLVTAESCTGGWVAKKITDLAGSSTVFDRGFVTYTNKAKHEMLDVSENTLESFGAVSEQVVEEMVRGALNNSSAQIAIAISGVAGPAGGTAEKPVGTVCFGWMLKDQKPESQTMLFSGDRETIRKKSVEYSLKGIIERIS